MRLSTACTCTKGLLAALLLSFASAQNNPPDRFENCDVSTYYRPLDADSTQWKRDDVHVLTQERHRDFVPQANNPRGEGDVWGALMELDAGPTQADTVRLIEQVPTVPFSGANWNKEWIWPQERGIDTDGLDAVDLHNIRPVQPIPTNLVKSDKYFGQLGVLRHGGSCVTPAEGSAEGSAVCNRAFQAPAVDRGVVARALLYMDLRYDGEEPRTTDLRLTDCPFNPPSDMAYLSQLLAWHEEFPPTEAEVTRNDMVCANYQGNRKPFVDVPQLARQIHGDPLPVPGDGEEREIYPACESIPTQAPTSLPNDCETITPGSVYFFLLNSVDPDEVAMFLFDDLPGNLDLYLTDNAWNGQGFLSNEGTLKLTTPPGGIDGDTFFGYGPWAPFGDDWETAGGEFSLPTTGDQVFLYCKDMDGDARPLAAISYNGNFSAPGLPSYGVNESALPDDLVDDGAIVLPQKANWFYSGPNDLETEDLKIAMRNTTFYWTGGSSRFEPVNDGGSGSMVWFGYGGIVMVTSFALVVTCAVFLGE